MIFNYTHFHVMLCFPVPYGNHGCNGGTILNTFQYVIDSNGVDREDKYSYKGRVRGGREGGKYMYVRNFFLSYCMQQSQCKFSKSYVGATATGVLKITPGSESDLQIAVATAGPVSVAIDGSSNAFRVSPLICIYRTTECCGVCSSIQVVCTMSQTAPLQNWVSQCSSSGMVSSRARATGCSRTGRAIAHLPS